MCQKLTFLTRQTKARLCTSQWGIPLRQRTSLCCKQIQQVNDLAMATQKKRYVSQAILLEVRGKDFTLIHSQRNTNKLNEYFERLIPID